MRGLNKLAAFFYSPHPNPLGNRSLRCSTSPIRGVVQQDAYMDVGK